MSQQTCLHVAIDDQTEYPFILPSDFLYEIMDWLKMHDPERLYTEYVYGNFFTKDKTVVCDRPSFRGMRVYIDHIEMALMFKLMFYDKCYPDHVRGGDDHYNFGTRF